jgi:glycosyltransferase involved in cell wall biosynthesis
MKIAFYMTTVLEHGGGLEKYLIETAANLNDYPGVTADIVTMDNNFTNRIIGYLSIFYFKKIDKKLSYKEDLKDIHRRLKKAHYYKISSLTSLKKRLQEYDVIYSKNELLEAFIFKFLVGYKHIPPVVFGGHTPLRYPHPENFHGKLHNFLYGGRLYRFLAGDVRRFHALNDYEAERYAKIFSKQKVTKIYNPFDAQEFKKRALAQSLPVELDTKKIHLLWVGRLTPQKGVHDLARVVRSVNQKVGDRTNFSWTIVGDGEQRDVIEPLLQECSNVTYLGHVDQKYMASIYQQHQLFISTSKWEGYPYTLIEPQAFGLQIYAYSIPGVTDILNAYEGGHLVKNQTEMIDILTESLLKYDSPMAIPRSSTSEQFNPQLIYGQILNLLTIRTT